MRKSVMVITVLAAAFFICCVLTSCEKKVEKTFDLQMQVETTGSTVGSEVKILYQVSPVTNVVDANDNGEIINRKKFGLRFAYAIEDPDVREVKYTFALYKDGEFENKEYDTQRNRYERLIYPVGSEITVQDFGFDSGYLYSFGAAIYENIYENDMYVKAFYIDSDGKRHDLFERFFDISEMYETVYGEYPLESDLKETNK